MDAKKRFSLIKKYGNFTLAYSLLQKDMEYFDLEGVGFIGFMRSFNRINVLADPICNPKDKRKLIESFLEKYSKNVVFYQISYETGKILNKLGFYVNRFGLESTINLQSYNILDHKLKGVYRLIKKVQDQKIIVRELDYKNINKNIIDNISKEWIRTRIVNRNELSFMVRPLEHKNEQDVRRFFAMKGKKILGYSYFDPLYYKNKIIGYYWDIHRNRNDAPKGISYFILNEAINKFKKERIKFVEIGISVCKLNSVNESEKLIEEFNYSRSTRFIFNLFYNYCNFMYNFKGLTFSKSRFHAKERIIYFATRSRFALIDMFLGYLSIGINPFLQSLNLFKIRRKHKN